MSRHRLISFLAHLRRTLGRSEFAELPDAALLERFVQLREEAAFELLVWRHANMVFGMCRRLLRDEHDAEDAFQATFLTLARKAASIGRREAVANWLHQVAYRCSLRLRHMRQRQRQGIICSIDPASLAMPDASLTAVEDSDLRAIIDEEVARLPAKYRAAVVLCYLEGKSYQQAAQELGCPPGTLSTRLHAAREKLRRRLTARGIAPAAPLVLLERAHEIHAATRLAAIVVQAAERIHMGRSVADVVSSRTLEICTGVIQTMSASKVKIIVILLLLGCLSGLTGWAAWRVLPRSQQEQQAVNTDKPVSAKKEATTATWQECARLLGSLGPDAYYTYFSPDESSLAAVGPGTILRVWNTSNWEVRWQYDCRRSYGEHFGSLRPFSPDGRLIGLTGSVSDTDKPGQRKQEIILLDAATGREVAHLPGYWITYAPDRVTAAVWHDDRVTLWDLKTFCEKRTLTAVGTLCKYVMTFSKDATLLCAPTQAGRCHLWETATDKERARPEGFMPQFSPDGKTLVTVLPGGVVKLWDTTDGRERTTIRHGGWISCETSFSANGKYLLVRSGGLGLKANGDLFFSKGKFRHELHIHPVNVCLYDPYTGAKCIRLPGDTYYDVSTAYFALGGQIVIYERLERDETDRHEVVLWDVEAGKERTVLRATEGMRCQCVLAQGNLLLTADDWGKNPQLWDVATSRRLFDLPADSGLDLSPKGQWLLVVTPKLLMPPAVGDIRVFHRSDTPLPPPVVRGESVKAPSPPPPPSPLPPPESEAARAFKAVRQDAQKYEQEILPKFKDSRPGPERSRLERERIAAYLRFGAEALKVARNFPNDPAALEALEFVLRSVGGVEGQESDTLCDEALTRILRDHARSAELSNLVFWMSHTHHDSAERTLAEIAASNPHRVIRGRAAWRLADALTEKADAARLIHALPELLDDPELAGRKNHLKHLQKIDADAVARSAEEWYVKVRNGYADVPIYDGSKKTLGESAENGLFALRNLAIGKIAPDIEGEDLDGKRFHLNDYHGKVVVLIFSGHWCGPCRQMNRQKQQLVERYASKPFALVEVNSDEDREAVRRIMRKEKLTWRCWFDGGREGPIARRWGVYRWPTIFVLDAKGVIRYKELRGPMLDRIVDRLMKENGEGK